MTVHANTDKGDIVSSYTPKVEGTHVYDTQMSRQGRALNKMLYSLKEPKNRELFSVDEAAYCDKHELSAEQKTAVLDRDWKKMTEIGGSIFYVIKLAAIDKKSMQDLGGVFTGMSTEQFKAELKAGGRNFG
ncbi:protocatechuate 3,4-dioxygenase [Brevibacterium sp. UCMA 11752]|uniref:protocatechuate 3,4-dioxygenase n=1 Tax=Brevibacterium sp. UCMA 11752 TaxID=2745946 RepID=UPI001F477CE8|nr:protocatechuate 3,4-dioxygenase [Brevibacterium sp. UCMA 11752]MCF2585801.1 protocatechuate 3,4-dioxygenase [Brevibacterium sp. UCMA 11752]